MSTYKPQKSSIYLYDFQFNGCRFHGSTGQKTKRAADRVEARKRAEAALDTGARKKPFITLDDAAGIYEDKLRASDRWSVDTERWIMGLLAAIGPDRYLSDIGEHEIAAHAARRAGQVSGSSVNREIDVWRALWRSVRRTHEIGEMPDWGALRYNVREPNTRELIGGEEQRLFAALRTDYHPFIRFLLLSGWRTTEARELRWSDLDLGQQVAYRRVKGGETIIRPLTTGMVALIANQPKVCPFVFTYVCLQSRGKRKKGERYPFSKSGWRKAWTAALREAGIEKFRPHDLRHTRGTRIVRRTGNLAVAQKALAHKNIRTTMRYVHASDQDVRDGLEASESRYIPETDNEKEQKPSNSAG